MEGEKKGPNPKEKQIFLEVNSISLANIVEMFSQIQQNEDSCIQRVSLLKLTEKRITMTKIRPKSYTQGACRKREARPEKPNLIPEGWK